MWNPIKQGGYALIIVLWSIVILTIIFSYLLDDFLLDSLLIEGYSQQKRLRQAAVSAYNIGLNTLLNDETIYDTQKEDWLKPIEGNIDGVDYTVNISDVGSKININYDPFKILRGIEDWDEEIEGYLEEDLIADVFLLKELLSEENYQVLEEYTTTYGNYNLNQDPVKKLKKLLDLLDLDINSDTVISSLEKYREEGKKISNLEELPNILNGLGSTDKLDILKSYLSIEGRININLVDEEILTAIFTANDLDEKTIKKVISFRKDNEIKEIGDLGSLMNDEKLAGLFTTHSQYLGLSVDVAVDENRKYKIECVIRRNFEEEKWSIKVISWSENDISWSGNNEDKEI